MKTFSSGFLFGILGVIMLLSCSGDEVKVVTGKNFELRVAPNQKAVLVLFPCFPCDIENTKIEAKFLKDIEREGITTLLLGYNQRLFLSEPEKEEYAMVINSILDRNSVTKDNVYIGGFSGGGNISVVLANYLVEQEDALQPQGVFAVDSPLDIERLYQNAELDIKRNPVEESVAESKYIVDMLEKKIGRPNEVPAKYRQLSPYTMSTDATDNIAYLKNTKIRFYYEIDQEVQDLKRRNREDLNAYMLEKAHESLVKLGNKRAELIETTNRGIRANGEKNTHSWSLVEQGSLVSWMLE